MLTTSTRTRKRLAIVLAAAVAAAVVLGAVQLFGGPTTVAGDAAATAPSAAPVTTAAAPVPTESGADEPAAPAPDGTATPVEAVRGFVGSLDAGNGQQAWVLMHPRYRAGFDSYAAFVADEGPAAQFGSFAVLGPGAYQSAVFEAAVDDEQVSVVSMFGEITRDGTQRTEAIAVAVRRAPSGWLVDAGGAGGSVFQNPGDPGEQLTAGDDVVLWTPSAGLLEVLAVVDDEPRTTTVTELDVPSETAEVGIDDYSPGVQQAVVGVLKEDGSVVTVATWFSV